MKTNQTENRPRHPASPSAGRATLLRSLGTFALALLLAGFTLAAQAQTTAKATATVSYGFVVAYTVMDGGSGYTEPPVVTLVGGAGTGATAVALVTNGVVTKINPVSPGSGYTSPPEVVISAPPVIPFVLEVQVVPVVKIRGTPGDTNEIQFSPTLTGAVWVTLTNVVLTGSVLEWYDRISPPGTRGFYRSLLVGAGGRPTPGPRFVWLPAGQFVMGSPESERTNRWHYEFPQTQVTLTVGFFIGRYEVTQGEYQSVVGSNPSGYSGDANRPVEMVSWDDATNYCAKLTAQERLADRLPAGWLYRLPTEAEWEYACRAGSTNRFSWGEDTDYTQLSNYAWYYDNQIGGTSPVGAKLPNRWGLYDMAGNVWEWCSDWLGLYPGGSVSDPQGAASGSQRVGRGGGFYHSKEHCWSAQRGGSTPDYKWNSQGFRVVLAPVRP